MKSTLLTLLAVPFLALAVQAEDTPAKPKKPRMDPAEAFAKADKDNDKSLSLEEFKASPRFKKDASKAEEIFKRKDKDNDSKLSLEEFTAAPKKPRKP